MMAEELSIVSPELPRNSVKMAKRIAYLLLAFSIVFPRTAYSTTGKECAGKLSPDLISLIKNTFPDSSIPELGDLDSQYSADDINDGGNGCYVVTSGDFDGDHHNDSALWLKSAKNENPHLIVALRRGASWKIYELPSFCEELRYCYVEPEKPGTYTRAIEINSPINRPDERSQLTSKTTSVLAGVLESTGIDYVFSKGKWLYVWVSD
jgi:hypothetical protein